MPSDWSYRNIGRTVDQGIEFTVENSLDDWYWWANLSWQDDPDIQGADPADVNQAPEWRLNLGVGQDFGSVFWNVNANYQDDSYWADVLFVRAELDGFTQVNTSVGWRFRNEQLGVKLIVQNLFDEELQQHIFGDILERRVKAQISYAF